MREKGFNLAAGIFKWVILAVGFAGMVPWPASAQTNPQSKAAAKVSSWTGCIDEQDGHYLLVDDRELKPIADLRADGFPEEAFAKHMGHKVIVRGTSSPGDVRPVVRVRTVELVSETCAPQLNL